MVNTQTFQMKSRRLLRYHDKTFSFYGEYILLDLSDIVFLLRNRFSLIFMVPCWYLLLILSAQ